MEVENVSSSTVTSVNKDGEDDVPLPGFRFHPTDEELVGFYLRRKVEKRQISIELIKQADIYKYDPWDLPKSSNVGDKEWYFFCKRGRKYRNSIRPNRVTGSGFWKATGIDRPIHSEKRDCIGLKKSLVYYRGSAGKGTKTDWMMHEFRLPASHDMKSVKHIDAKSIAQEAEVWTLCRIFKRTASYRKCTPDWRELAAKKNNVAAQILIDASSKTCSTDSSDQYHTNMSQSNYISFNNNAQAVIAQTDTKPFSTHAQSTIANQHEFVGHFTSSSPLLSQAPSSADSSFSGSNYMCGDINYDFLRHADWEDLQSIVEYTATETAAANPFYL